MAASNQTISDVLAIMRRYIGDDEALGRALEELAQIKGNVSYRETIERLREEQARKPRRLAAG